MIYECTYLIIQKYKIHLYKNECHSRRWCQCQKDIMTFGIRIQLKILAKLQAWINHAANAESCAKKDKIKRKDMKEMLEKDNEMCWEKIKHKLELIKTSHGF